MLDAGRVDDSRRRVETVAVEARGGLVEDLLVEDLGQDLLVVVPAHDRDGRDRGRRPHRRERSGAIRPRRAASPGQVVDRGREDVRDLLGDQLLGRRHADVDRLGQPPDGGARLVAERGVRLVADDQLVRLARERVDVAREPRVRLNRDRVLAERLAVAQDGVVQALAVALRGQVGRELVHEQAPVREDEDAHRPGGLDEAGGGDRLPGGRRVAEAEAPDSAGVVSRGELVDFLALALGFDLLILRDDLLLEVLLFLRPLLELHCVAVAVPFSASSSCRAISSASIPARASIWWRRSSVPEASRGGRSVSTRSRPSISA